jgi:glycosyltransferase involved in cell wall biosynthesis
MEKISTTVITYNEEKDIADCLKSVRPFSDEILVVDSLSTDRTAAIAKRLGARVVRQRFLGHVRQKDLAARLAKHDRIFSLDADERASPGLARRILALKKEGFRRDGYFVNRLNWYLTGWFRLGGWYPDRKVRLFDRRKARWAGQNPHDYVRMAKAARTGVLNEDLLHYTYRTLSDHIRQIDSFSSSAAREKRGNAPAFVAFKLLFTPAFTFFKMYVLRLGFLAGMRGFVISAMSSFSDLAKYAKTWELQRGGKKDR